MTTRRKKYMRPTKDEAEKAVRTLIAWAGDNPDREGLKETPGRVVEAFEEYFSGYKTDPTVYLQKTFEEVAGYDEVILLRDIRFESHCEHHLAPIIGVAHVAYLPNKRVVGISKLARVVEIFSKRLQIQEKMTAEIAHTIDQILQPLGVIVLIEATHHCMSTRGIYKPGSSMITSHTTGVLKTDDDLRREVLGMIQSKNGLSG